MDLLGGLGAKATTPFTISAALAAIATICTATAAAPAAQPAASAGTATDVLRHVRSERVG